MAILHGKLAPSQIATFTPRIWNFWAQKVQKSQILKGVGKFSRHHALAWCFGKNLDIFLSKKSDFSGRRARARAARAASALVPYERYTIWAHF